MAMPLPNICDVLVVGAGAGGMAAAFTAAVAGLDVQLVEKADVVGGSTALSGGVVWAPGTAAVRGEDPEFDKGGDAYQRHIGEAGHAPNPCIAPLTEPPFFSVRLRAGDIGSFAGLRVDGDARVLRPDGTPVFGLHAVGNDMASVMGGTYPGPGITLGPALTFGVLAAECLIAG